MQAVEFEADVIGNTIQIPSDVKGLSSKHVKVIVLVEDSSSNQYDFSDMVGQLEWNGDAVAEQRKQRGEW